MRILTLGRLPAHEIGGLPNYTAGLASAMVELGHDCRVVHPGNDLDPELYPFPTCGSGSVDWPARGKLRHFRQAFQAARTLTRLAGAGQPHVIHVQYGGAMDLAILGRLARLGPPLVVTAHCGRAWSHLAHTARLAARRLAHATRVLTLTEDQRELFRGAGLDQGRIAPVGTLIDAEFFSPLPLRSTSPRGPRRGLYLGRITPEKGLETVIAALQRLSPGQRPQICATGPVEPAYAKRLLRLANGLGDRFRLGAPVHGVESRRDLLDRADFLLHPTSSDVKPLGVIEAMARGLPVLASDLPGTVELLGGTGATFPVGDAPALAQQLARLGQEAAYLSPEQGRLGRSLADEFTPRAAALETLNHMQSCLESAA